MNTGLIPKKIYSLPGITEKIKEWKQQGKKIVFINSVFDMLHKGHILSLTQAAKEGDILIVGLNDDSRALALASLVMVDAVVIFNDETPLKLIISILPDVLVKNGDYTLDQVAGAKEVIANGGKVVINPIPEDYLIR
jgi:D-beta-D-heptose 7-phosphate kinase/D-beta-D-heptose 1-phosphate adenosyltransferase